MGHQSSIEIFIGFGILVMIVLALIVILFSLNYRKTVLEKEKKIQLMEQEKRIEIFKAAVEAEEKQKEKIANNLHDEIIPLLSILILNNDKQGKDLVQNKLEIDSLKDTAYLLEQSISGIKTIALDLIPKVLLNLGLVKALEQYTRHLNRSGDQAIELDDRTDIGINGPFSKNEQVNLYRLCLEITNNLRKHGDFSFLRITLERNETNFLIDFRHDGKGVTNVEIDAYTESSNGLGLKSIKSRLLILNADINYSTEMDMAAISINVPIPSV